MDDQFEAFLAQAESLSHLVEDISPAVAENTRRTLTMEEVFGLRQVIITGSGDSHIAAIAAAPVVRAMTGLPVTAMPAMEAARYVDAAPVVGRATGILAVAISSSGEAARLVEASRRLRRLGALTLAVTANPGSRLGQAAERRVDIAIPPAPPAPGTRSYVASLLGVLHVAIRVGEMRMAMTMDAADALRREIAALAGPLADAFGASVAAAEGFGVDWAETVAADCLGSGPLLGSASYAAAKLVEAAGLHAAPQDAEEFHHLNYFVDDPGSVPAIVFASGSGAALGRKTELLGALAELGRPTLVVGDDARLERGPPLLRVAPCREAWAPILHAVPAAVLAAHAARARGAAHYRGHTGPWRGAQGAGLVRNSAIVMREDA